MKCISSTLSLESIPDRGILIHPLFGETILWRQHEFHTWWNLFETMVDHPLSRILINAIVDSLEYKHTIPNVGGLFRKKKFHKEMERVTTQLGWGTVSIEQQNVVSSAHPLLSVALGQYLLESYLQERFKVRWIEPMPQTVQLETEPSSPLPHPQPQERFPWSLEHNSQYVKSPLIIEIHSENELRYEGERVVLIPIESLNRFLIGCLPYVPQMDDRWFDGKSCQLNSHEHLFKLTIESISEMFLKSEQPVYIIDESSWTAYIEHYLCERGWGRANVTEYSTETYDLELTIAMQCQLPYVVGLMCGMWQRAHGRAYQVSLRNKNDTFVVKIQSLLAYDNQ